MLNENAFGGASDWLSAQVVGDTASHSLLAPFCSRGIDACDDFLGILRAVARIVNRLDLVEVVLVRLGRVVGERRGSDAASDGVVFGFLTLRLRSVGTKDDVGERVAVGRGGL